MHQDEEKTMEKQRLDVQYTEYKIGRVITVVNACLQTPTVVEVVAH